MLITTNRRMNSFKSMDTLPVVLVSCLVIAMQCVAQDNKCPSPPIPTVTCQQELPYVESENENEWCFYPSGPAGGTVCSVGYYCNPIGSPCLPCPYNESGIKTFQPRENRCPKCIVCRDCEREGMEQVSGCTKRQDTNAECRKRRPEPPDNDHSTTAAEEEDTHSSSKTQTSSPPSNPELDQLREEIYLLKWIVGCAVSLLVIILVGYALYKLKKKYKSSATSHGEQDGNQNSGPSSNPDLQDDNQNSGPSNNPGEGGGERGEESQPLFPGEEPRPTVNTDTAIPMQAIGESSAAQSTNDNTEPDPRNNSGNEGVNDDEGDIQTEL